MNLIKRVLAIGALAAVAASLAACSADGGTDTPQGGDTGATGGEQTLSVGRLGIGVDAILSIGRDQGFYSEHNLTITDNVVANPPAALAAVQSGQIDIAYSTVPAFLQALAQGIELTAVAAAEGTGVSSGADQNEFDLEQSGLFVNPDSGITAPGQLAGKTVAVLARNGTSEIAVAAAIRKDGGDPATVNWVTLDFASAIEALKGGTIDAAAVVMPFTNNAEAEGLVQIAAPTVELFGQGAVTSLWVSTPATVEAKSEAIAAFVAAQGQATEYANANIEESMEQVKTLTGINLPTDQMTPLHWMTEIDAAQLQEQADLVLDLGYLPSEVDVASHVYQP